MASLRVISLSLLLIINCILIYSCNTTEPGQNIQISLSVEDISCTEVWLRLKTEGTVTSSITISVNEKPEKQFSITGSGIDTIVFIDSLLPNQQYTFVAANNNSGKKEVTAKTMDTTSHDFTWETFQFGDHGSSLSDVVIIDGENIWGVGEIYLNGETDMYNIVHWDGEKWELKRIPVKDYGDTYFYSQLRSVYAFSENDVWFAGYADLIQWNGSSYTSKAFFMLSAPFTGQVNQMWGTGSSNIYCVGNGGAIYHYTGQSWKTIESGTNTSMIDIWGIENNGDITAYCTVSSSFETGDVKIIKIRNNEIDSISLNNDQLLNGVWTDNERYIYVCGWGVFENKKGFWTEIDLPSVTTNSIRGNGLNDIFVAGDFGLVAHYNGSGWKIYYDIYDAGYGRIDIRGNVVAISGQREGKGIISIGKRN